MRYWRDVRKNVCLGMNYLQKNVSMCQVYLRKNVDVICKDLFYRGLAGRCSLGMIQQPFSERSLNGC